MQHWRAQQERGIWSRIFAKLQKNVSEEKTLTQKLMVHAETGIVELIFGNNMKGSGWPACENAQQ